MKQQKLSRLLKNTSGMTMTEVLVAFAVLMLLMALFSGVTAVCLKLIRRSDTARRSIETAYESYYLDDDHTDAERLFGGSFTLTDAAGHTLSVDLAAGSEHYEGGSVGFYTDAG